MRWNTGVQNTEGDSLELDSDWNPVGPDLLA